MVETREARPAATGEARIDEIRRLLSAAGYVLLGPINPGADAETRARVGWVAPYGRESIRASVTGAGHGPTALDAAEDAWTQFEAEFGSPPGTAE